MPLTSRLARASLLAALSCASACKGLDTVVDGCPQNHTSAHATIGPAAHATAICGGQALVPVATINALGAGRVDYAVTSDEVPGFPATNTVSAELCGPGSAVAFVTFAPPAGAVPGRGFDTVVTVASLDGSFATGTVAVHGEATLPSVTGPTTLDFGDLVDGADLTFPLRNNSSSAVTVSTPPAHDAFAAEGALDGSLDVAPNQTVQLVVRASGLVAGDHDADLAWKVSPLAGTDTPDACAVTYVVHLHAHIVDAAVPDAGADGDTDAGTDAEVGSDAGRG